MKVIYDLNDIHLSSVSSTEHFQIVSFSDHQIILAFYEPIQKIFNSIKVIDPDSDDLVFTHIEEILPEINLKCKKKILILPSNQFSLIPDSYFDENLSQNYFKINFKINSGDRIISAKIPHLHAHIVYSINQNIITENEIKKFDLILSDAEIFISSAIKHVNFNDRKSMFINIDNHHIKIASFHFDQLKLYNSYAFTTNEDILYLIINVSQQTGIDPEHNLYYLSGEISEISNRFTFLQKYIRYISIRHGFSDFTFSESFKNFTKSKFYNFFSSVLCV